MNVGGPATLLGGFDQHLDKSKFIHTLITGSVHEGEIDYLDSHEFYSEVIRIRQMKRSIFLLNDLFSFIRLRKILKQINPDIVHTHTSKAGVLGRLAVITLSGRIKIVHTYHGHLLYGYFKKYKVRIFTLIEKILGYFSSALIAVAKSVASDLRDVGIGRNARWEIIPPGIELYAPEIKPVQSEKVLRVTWIGRFTEIKNPKLALLAFDMIEPTTRNHYRFTMVGDGELLDASKSFARERSLEVSFPGWATDVDEFLRDSDLLIMTSENEGMPVVIIEAAKWEVPCLSTNVGGVTEFIKPDMTGFLTNGTAHDLANALQKLENDRDLLNRAGVRAREQAINGFSIKGYARKHEVLYSRLMELNQ